MTEKKRNRKEEEEELSVNEDYQSAFRKSKKIIRSPDQRKQEQLRDGKEEVDDNKTGDMVQRVLRQMMDDMVKTMKDEMAKNTEQLKQEIHGIREEMQKKEEKW